MIFKRKKLSYTINVSKNLDKNKISGKFIWSVCRNFVQFLSLLQTAIYHISSQKSIQWQKMKWSMIRETLECKRYSLFSLYLLDRIPTNCFLFLLKNLILLKTSRDSNGDFSYSLAYTSLWAIRVWCVHLLFLWLELRCMTFFLGFNLITSLFFWHLKGKFTIWRYDIKLSMPCCVKVPKILVLRQWLIKMIFFLTLTMEQRFPVPSSRFQNSRFKSNLGLLRIESSALGKEIFFSTFQGKPKTVCNRYFSDLFLQFRPKYFRDFIRNLRIYSLFNCYKFEYS